MKERRIRLEKRTAKREKKYLSGIEDALYGKLEGKKITQEILEKNGIKFKYQAEYQEGINDKLNPGNYPIKTFEYGEQLIYVVLSPRYASIQVTSEDGRRYINIEKSSELSLVDLQDAIDFCKLGIELVC